MIRGEIHTFPLPDLIHWLALTRRTGQLAISQGDRRLEFSFAAGEIAAANSTDILGGDPAENARAVLASAIKQDWGYFVFDDGPLPARTNAANLRLSAEVLLRDVINQINEEKIAESASDEASSEAKTVAMADELRIKVVDHLLREEFSVPPMPQLASRVLELTRDDNFSLRDLGDLVLTDQAVAAQVLRYANSALYASSRKVDTLPMAVQRLGSEEVVKVVLATTLNARRKGPDMFAAQRKRLWLHSSTTALFARALSVRAGLEHNLGFLCGLLTDFGMNVLYSIIEGVLNRGTSSASVVEEIIQDYHPRVGRVVGEKWRLPQETIDSMAYHHCFETAPIEHKYVALAALSDFLATFALSHPRDRLDAAVADFPLDKLSNHPAAKIIGLRPIDAATVLNEVPNLVDQATRLVVE